MTDQAPWPARPVPPQGLDVTVPNVARIYDYLLGGKDNFEADREAARRLLVAVPGAARAARANRGTGAETRRPAPVPVNGSVNRTRRDGLRWGRQPGRPETAQPMFAVVGSDA